MDEKEIKDNIDSTNNLWTENNNDNAFVEVVENKKIEDTEENIQNQNNTYPSSTSKLTSVVYLVIFISILIWVYFYVTQNKDILDKLTGKDATNSWQVETTTWEIDSTTNTGIETDNTNTGNIENNDLEENINNIDNEKEPSTTTTSTTTTKTSWTTNKNEDVIIKDFEKELDSLFYMIDENAK